MSYIAGNGITIQNDVISSKTTSTSEIGSFKVDGSTIYIDNNNVIHGKKDQKITLSDYTLEIGSESTTVTVLNHKGDGTLSVSSDDTDVVTASISGNTITITGVSSGNAVVTVSASSTASYLEATATISVTCNMVRIYGAEWDGSSSPAWTRTDDATDFEDPNPYYAGMSGSPSSPFDNISPWKDMRIVEDANAGTLVEIPKFYYKWTRNGSAMKLQISMTQEDGFLCSPAHADRGDGVGERDYMYVGRYHCGTNYKSVSGVSPINSYTISEFRTSIHNSLKSYVWQNDFAMRWTVNMLYLVEFANWNSQAMIGNGCGNGSSVGKMGYTDNMGYHTGTTQSSRTTYGLGTQYRYIEGWWDNVFDFIDGIYVNYGRVYCIKKPEDFSNNNKGVGVGGGSAITSSKYVTAWTAPSSSGFEYALYPSSTSSGGSNSTYTCDYCSGWSDASCAVSAGGCYSRSLNYGAFYLNGSHRASSASGTNLGSRLMVLPPSRLSPP